MGKFTDSSRLLDRLERYEEPNEETVWNSANNYRILWCSQDDWALSPSKSVRSTPGGHQSYYGLLVACPPHSTELCFSLSLDSLLF